MAESGSAIGGVGPRLRALLGHKRCLDQRAARLVYARDASHLRIGLPLCVCLPENSAEIAEIITICRDCGTPYVARGAGTGLSGGALPGDGHVVISLARLKGAGEVDSLNRILSAEVGLTNAEAGGLARAQGLEFAPDPGSRNASMIGGNIAENAGGPHCLKSGVTATHVHRLQWLDGQGRCWRSQTDLCAERGFDPAVLQLGGEGTLGIVAAADLRLIPVGDSSATLLAFFDDLEAAARSVVMILSAGLLPAAMEIVDAAMLELVETAFAFGFPTGYAGAMIIEFTGRGEAVAEDSRRARDLLKKAGADSIRLAEDEAQREELWRCRRQAFGAVGRLSPNYVTMDVTVPLRELPAFVREIAEIGAAQDVKIASAMHAGDGNLHPGVLYDARDPQSHRRADAAADAIIRAALRRGGSATGEHGIGIEKLDYLDLQLDPVALDLMEAIRELIDPEGLCNPGKAIGRDPQRAPSRWRGPPRPETPALDRQSLILSTSAGVGWMDLQRLAAEAGLCLGAGLCAESLRLSDMLLHGSCGPAACAQSAVADGVLQIWARSGDGRSFALGTPTLKNVAGYDLIRLLLGSGGVLAQIDAATLALRPAPESVAIWDWDPGADLDDPALASLRDILLKGVSGGRSISIGPDGGLRIIASGRDRDWDLGDLDRQLADWAGRHDLGRVRFEIRSWREALAADAAMLPDSRIWTVLRRGTGGAPWPRTLPTDVARVWQAYPESLWIAGEAVPADPLWRRQTVLREGRPTELPAPDTDAPLDLLRGLKGIFDPGEALVTPDWLVEGS